MAAVVTIDLGVVEDWEVADDDTVGLPRGWSLLGVLLLVLSLVSAVPLPDRPRELSRQPLRNGAFHLAGGMLFVLDSDRTPSPVEAFDPADGTLWWNYTPPGLASLSHVDLRGGTAVFSPDLCRSGTTGTTVAVDRAGGRELWRAVGVPVTTPPGSPTVVMRSLWSDGCRALTYNNPTAGVLRWQSIGPAGEILWDTAVEAGTRIAVDTASAGATWAALRDRDGGLSTVDLRTGARSATVTTPALAADEAFAVVGTLLVVMTWDPVGGGTTVRAYTRQLRLAWQATATTGPGGPLRATPCGQLLCVTGRSTAAFDPLTGALQWLRAGDAAYTPPDGWRVLAEDGDRYLIGLPTDGDTVLAWSTSRLPFATIDGTLDRCEIDGALLACSTDLDEVLVLRVTS